MPKKSTQPRDPMQPYYPDIGGPDDDDDTKKNTSLDPQAALLAKMGALEERFNQTQRENESLRQQQHAILSQPIRQVPASGPQLVEVPDPVADPQGHAKALRDNIRAELNYERDIERAQMQEQQTIQARTNGLWNDFSSKYADYAKDPERVKIAATQVAEEARARGIDVNKYMFLTSDQYMSDVKAKMDKFGWGAREEEEDEEEDDNRTGGILGGLESGGKTARAPEKAGSIYDDLKEWQLKTGFHR